MRKIKQILSACLITCIATTMWSSLLQEKVFAKDNDINVIAD